MKKFGMMWAAAAALSSGAVLTCAAQQAVPAMPQSPSAARPVSANPFPATNPKNFTATSPTADEVDAFLKALWGYEPNRIWHVSAILKTPAPGVSKVVVLVADKNQPGRTQATTFFITPDGKHAIADNVIDFGAKPFAETRALLQEQADGPAHGAKGKELLVVEFGDLQCAQCAEAQSKMDNLMQDFPQARVVFENFPQENRPFSMRAALEGECLRRSKGDAAFFNYAQTVYDMQSALTPERGEATLAAAVTKAGGDSTTIATCATGQPAKDAIAAQMKLGSSLGVAEAPVIVVNGHVLPLGNLPYDVLKRIVAFQAGQDGVEVHVQPTLSTLK